MEVDIPFVWHGDGREAAVLNHILSLPNLDQLKGRPKAILSAIDEWSEKNKVLMTIGPERGDLILGLIDQSKPKVMVELGGYIGYSAVKFGDAVRLAGGEKYLSLESSSEYAEVARSIIQLAGLEDFVRVLVEPSSGSLATIAKEQSAFKIDMFFIDHSGKLYLKDLRLAEEHNMLSPSALVIADNICDPNAQDYVARMQGLEGHGENPISNITQTKTKDRDGVFESDVFNFQLPTGDPDGVMVSRRL